MFRMLARLLAALMMLAPGQTFASQANVFLPTTGTYSGLTAANTLNSAMDALLTCNKGSVAPTNALGGVAKAGQCWLDDTNANSLVKKRYSGAAWVVEGVIDVTNGFWVPPLGGGGVGTISSATTMDIGAQAQAVLNVTGTTTITSFGSTTPTGAKVLIFTQALTLTHNATSLILPGAQNLVAAVGDSLMAVPLGSGNWRVVNYARADGSAVVADLQLVSAVIHGQFGDVPSKYVRGEGQALSRATYPDFLARSTKTQTGTRTSGNATITSVADTTGFGAGMPVEGTGINAGCTIASVVANTSVTLNSSSCVTSSGTANITVFPFGYGSGGDSTTVGVINCQNRMLAGLDRTGVNLITTAGSSINGTIANASGGGQSSTLGTSNLPAYTPSGSVSGTASVSGNTNAQTPNNFGSGVGSFVVAVQSGGSSSYAISSSGSISASFAGNAQGGTATPFSNMPPTLITPCIVRVFGMHIPANDNPRRGPTNRAPDLYDLRRFG